MIRQLGDIKKQVEQSDVLHQSREAGEILLNNGLTALEAIGSVVGKKAADALAEAAVSLWLFQCLFIAS